MICFLFQIKLIKNEKEFERKVYIVSVRVWTETYVYEGLSKSEGKDKGEKNISDILLI